MSFVSKLIILSIIVAGLACWWSFSLNAPEGLEQRSEVTLMYGVVKVATFLTEMGEKIGLGHRSVLMRKLADLSVLESRKPTYNDIQIYKDSFSGVEVLIIEPVDKDPYGPALVWFHGGGWTIGSADADIDFIEELSKAMNMMIVSVEYRLAPEFPYPIPLEDCYVATRHFIENAIEHNVDPFRIGVGGISAGGNLATAVAMKIRDSDLMWKVKVQLLVAPCLQAYRFDTPSYVQNSNDDFLSRTAMANYWMWYAFGQDGHLLTEDFTQGRHLKVIDPKGTLSHFTDWKSLGIKPYPPNNDPSSSSSSLSKESENKIANLIGVLTDPLFAPLLASSLSGLPATYIVTSEFDVLRYDGLMFGERLKRHQVETKMMDYPGAFHYVLLWSDQYNVSKRVLKDMVDYLKVKL